MEADDDGVVLGGYRSTDDEHIEALVARVGADGRVGPTLSYRHPLGDAFVSGLALDGAGRIAVAGGVFSEAEDWDLWLAVYAPDGELAWSDVVAGEAGGEDQAVGIAADPEGGDLFAVGYVMDAAGATDVWMRRFGVAGDVRWEGTYDGALGGGIDVGTDVAFDPVTGSFLVVGYETIAEGDTDVLAMRIDDAGTAQWILRVDEAHGADRGQGIAPDGSGGAWVVGHAVVPGRTVDAWIGRIDADGRLRFRVLRDGPASLGDGANDVAVAADGTAVVGGHQFVQSGDGDGAGETAGKWHAWIEKVDADGAPLWTHVYGGPAPGDDVVAGVAVAPEGDVYAVGSVAATDSRREIWLRKLAN